MPNVLTLMGKVKELVDPMSERKICILELRDKVEWHRDKELRGGVRYWSGGSEKEEMVLHI